LRVKIPTVGLTTAAARTLLPPIEGSGGRAELVAQRLEEAIRMGLLLDGERLPAEPQLAAQLGVSTMTLREALATLREQGLVTTRPGRGGGSFVRAPADQGEPLQRFGIQELRDLGDQRAAIAGAAAGLAAERALPEEVQKLKEQVERVQAGTTPSERRRADAQLTVAVAAAAQSPRLTREDARLRAEVGDLLGLELGEIDHDALVRARRQLVDAIAKRKPERARELAEQHVSAETERLIRLRLELTGADARPADELLGDVAREVESVLAGLTELGGRFRELAARQLRSDDLEALRPTIFGLLAAHHELVTGAGVITAPGLLADSPHWLEWWWTRNGGAPEALRVNLDPTAPDFYDYTTADWYAMPERTSEPRMAGPYVDYFCTNEYAITLSCPVLAGDEMLGVAAADVLVASLEKRVVPALAALGRPAALTSADGRVIASNVASISPGRRLALSDKAARRARSRSPVSSWLLVDL
jgi:DNA-binding FadR family transcriptional regulator